MNINWKSYRLEEIADIIGGGTPSTQIPEYFGGEIPWLTPRDLTNYTFRFISKGERNITQAGLKNSSARLLPKDTILLTSRAPIGYLAIAENELTTNQGFKSFVLKENLVDRDFLFYLLKSNVEYIKSLGTGSTFGEVPAKTLKDLSFSFPEKVTDQKKIASILSSLDDKIELNLKMNQTLESIAQAIFRQWFVDYQFPGATGEMENELPKGWEKKSLDEIANFLNGLALQNSPPESETEFLPVIKIRELRQGITDSSDKASINIPKNYIVNNGDVLFSWSGSLEVVIWSGDKGALNQHLFKVSSTNYPKWFYYQWLKEHLLNFRAIASDKATTMGHIQRRHLREAIVIIPPEDKIEILNSIMNPIFEKILLNKLQIKSLEKIRDSLLPKLITGQISVN